MSEPTVQVPVSLPTREQIAEAAYYAEKRADYGDSWTERWEDESEGYQATYLAIADAVLALLSHPTPTAEPTHCRTCGYPRAGWHWDDCATHPQPTAKPPRIEDMAPGTTEIYQPDTHAIADSDLEDDLG